MQNLTIEYCATQYTVESSTELVIIDAIVIIMIVIATTK